MQFEKINIQDIIPAEYNPRIMPSTEMEKLKKGLTTFGLIDPIIIDLTDNNTVIGGHQRLEALKEIQPDTTLNLIRLGDIGLVIKETDIKIKDKNDQKAMNLALNKISGDWDYAKLDDILLELSEDNYLMELTGFDEEFSINLEEYTIPLQEDNEPDETLSKLQEPPIPDETTTNIQRGDIYQLGNHRVMCGDSTKSEDVNKLSGNDKMHLLFTDPPWNVNYGGVTHPSWKQRTIENDNMTSDQFHSFLKKALTNGKQVLTDGGMVYIVMSAKEWGTIMEVTQELEYHWSSTIIWNKDHHVLSRKDYHTKYEPIWYGWVKGPRIHPLQDRSQSDVWDFDRPTKSEEHPTMKPIPLVAQAILNSSNPEENILDLFGGSGTTLLAAEQTNRSCYMMEYDPKYCQVIIDRYETMTGLKAEKIN